MNAAAIRKYTGCRAEQLISGATRMVVIRSRRFSMTRVAITPGTAHANDDIRGTNDLPDNPTLVIRRSTMNAARAMYPQAFRKGRKKKKKTDWGGKKRTAPKPATKP